MQGVAQLLPILILGVLAYLLVIRPSRKRAREVATLQSTLSVGDEVMLTSGIFGRVDALSTVRDDNPAISDTMPAGDAVGEKVAVEISPGVVITVHRGAIGKIVTGAADASDSGEVS